VSCACIIPSRYCVARGQPPDLCAREGAKAALSVCASPVPYRTGKQSAVLPTHPGIRGLESGAIRLFCFSIS
jgi:hypothetical protein